MKDSIQPHDAGAFTRWGKRFAPRLSRLLTGRRSGTVTRLLETYLAILQGKGSGSGWDIEGETTAAVAFIGHLPQPVVVDGGANNGQWAVEMREALGGSAARFFLIEPQSSCQSVLKGLQLPNATIIRAALGEETGEMTLYADSVGAVTASVYERRDSFVGDVTAHTEIVPVTTLDAMIDEHGIEHIDLLKLDVEGAEPAALRGAAKALGDRRISTIAFEFGSGNINSRTYFRDLWDLLNGSGYKIWRIRPGGRLTPIHEYSEELEHFRGASNYIASRVPPRPPAKR
jgi:FkbM family methyltransferase